MEVYKDLRRSEEDRDNRQNFGIAPENVRKLVSKDDSANKAAKTDGVLDLNHCKHVRSHENPTRKNFVRSRTLCTVRNVRLRIPHYVTKLEKIMKAQDGEDVGVYKLTDMNLEYKIIESEDLAERVRGEYNVGRSLGYDYTTLLKTLPWGKDNTREVIDVNIPRKSMKAVVLLFTKKGAGDSEEFVFPNLTKVNVTVEGNPNDIYSAGLAKRDMCREAVKFFGSSTCEKYLGSKCVSRRKFYTDKFACVIDFRTVDDENVSGSGRKLVGTQAGILMEIEKETTTTDLSCHVFAIANGIIDIMVTKLNGTAQY